MRRAYLTPEVFDALLEGGARLPKDVAHHFAKVLRLDDGQAIELFDGEGRLMSAKFVSPHAVSDLVALKSPAPRCRSIIVQARVRQQKLDEVVRRASELGASEVWIFEAARSQKGNVRIDRLEKIAQQAARQSERTFVCQVKLIDDQEKLAAAIESFRGLKVCGTLSATESFSSTLAELPEEVLAIVGPEGGLSEDEIARFVRLGVKEVRLGAHVLRTETAQAAILSAIQVRLGDL